MDRLVIILCALCGCALYWYLLRRLEKTRLRDQRRYQTILRKLSATLSLIKDLDQLLKLIVYRVGRAVRVEFACIYLIQDSHGVYAQKFCYAKRKGPLPLPPQITDTHELIALLKVKHSPVLTEELTASIIKEFDIGRGLLVPAFVRGHLLGFIILGPKRSRAGYTHEDAVVFGILANQLALSIENTDFLTESQKIQAQLFAAERMTSLGTMAGGMSHQLNNRFHVIALAASDSLDTLKGIAGAYPADEALQKTFGLVMHALERIQENTRHGGKIVNDFLNFSHPDRVKAEAREFDICGPLERAIEMVTIKTAIPPGLIRKEIEPGLPLIEGNYVLLQDVFYNFLDNALDAIERKAVSLKSSRPETADQFRGAIDIRIRRCASRLEVVIRDNGIGVTEGEKEKLFVPFFTSKPTSAKGEGLGLFVIQKIIIAHQGTLSVDSTPGEGAAFTMRLPLTQKEGTDDA